MTTVTRPPRTTPETSDDGRGEVDLTFTQLLHRVYALFYNKRFGLLLILAMGFLTLCGVLFAQAPDSVRADPREYSAWLESLRPRYGGWTAVLSALGMFTMFESMGFRAVTVLLALSIIACTTHRLPQLWRQAARPHLHVRDTFFGRARTHATVRMNRPASEAMEAVREVMRRHRFRVLHDPDVPHGGYADRNRWAPMGTVIAHAAFVIILAGVLVTSTLGFRDDDLVAPVGERVEVGDGSGLMIEATNFTDEYHADGRPKDYFSDLVLYQHGRPVASKQVRVNTPLRWGGYAFHQASFGVAAAIDVTSADGTTLHRVVPLNQTTADNQNVFGRLDLPGRGLEAYVIGAASGADGSSIKAGQMMLEVYPVGERKPQTSSLLNQGKPVKVGELSFTFTREKQYTGLTASRDPGAPLVWLGSALIMIGMCLTMLWRHHRIWIRVDPDGDGARVRLASPDRHDSIFERRLAGFATELTKDHHA